MKRFFPVPMFALLMTMNPQAGVKSASEAAHAGMGVGIVARAVTIPPAPRPNDPPKPKQPPSSLTHNA